MLEAVLKQNSGFFMRPYGFFQEPNGGRVRRAETVVAGQIYSMSKDENVCRYGYSVFMKKNNMAKSTVARSIKSLDCSGKIKRTRRGGKSSEYTFSAETKSSSIRSENFFYTEKFNVEGVERYLTYSEIDVLSLIYTHTRSKQGNFEGTSQSIAAILGLTKKTVKLALKELLSLGLIYRPTKGVNNYAKSVFAANMKWIRAKERAFKKEEKKAKQAALPKSVVDANARADRDKFYADRRQEAQARADKYIQRARKNEEYNAVEKALRPYELLLAKAELYEKDKLPALQAQKAALELKRKKLLAAMDIEPWQLEVEGHCKCRKCFDVGVLPDGRACDCYVT